MDYVEAAKKLLQLLAGAAAGADSDEGLAAEALERAGAVHTEALISSLSAYNIMLHQVISEQQTGADNPKTTGSGAKLQPMPEASAEIQLDFPLTAAQFAMLESGEDPADDFNRWFMDFEDMHVRYYRNATGYCFFDGLVEPDGDGYRVTTVAVNQDDNQYSETNLGVCAAQMKVLLANNLGLDDEPYWDEMDAAADLEQD